MVPSLSWLRAVAIASSIGLALTACASRPKPMGPAATAAPTQPPPPEPRADDGRNLGAEGVTEGALPGSARDFVIKAGDLVYFDFDRFEVRSEARAVLDLQAAWLSRYPNVHVRIEGNTDERGTREYNLALGARRANAVRDYLVQRGIDGSRIETVSYGKERPIDTSTGDKADAINRNAHTVVTSGAR
jgi:peptidoglycan-associated lipoprotein